jgi:GT2 family glycosyltransferase
VTVVVPTLGNPLLAACVASLERQSFRDMEIIVVDNSDAGEAGRVLPPGSRARVIANRGNRGFGAAINQGFTLLPAEFLATLNDDAQASERWVESLVAALDGVPAAGMAASLVILDDTGLVDSAGMLIARDGTSKQRGHGAAAADWLSPGEALCPSGSAAIYRAAMLGQTGMFEESFFLYCEDTDLGLRGRWAGWSCLFVPEAAVRHHYSASAGRASARKAWLVERNRLRLAVRCLPASWLWMAPLASIGRYFWHAVSLLEGKGKAAEYVGGGGGALSLLRIVFGAHLDLLRNLPELWRQRRAIQSGAPGAPGMAALLARHRIGLREVARL